MQQVVDRKGYTGFAFASDEGDTKIAECSCDRQYVYPETEKTCSKCGEQFQYTNTIGLACVMKENTRYSEKFDAYYMDENKNRKLINLGTYGMGISRLLYALVDQHKDKLGIRWPAEVVPNRFQCYSC